AAVCTRSVATTRAPSRASASAPARPMPEPAPVTIATLPSTLPIVARPLLHFDDLDPVRSVADRIAAGLAEFAACLVDLVDREMVRLLARGDQITPARIDPDAARLRLGREVRDVSELAGAGRYGEQGDLVGRALGRIEELAVGRD